jgi:hypothetical protein
MDWIESLLQGKAKLVLKSLATIILRCWIASIYYSLSNTRDYSVWMPQYSTITDVLATFSPKFGWLPASKTARACLSA